MKKIFTTLFDYNYAARGLVMAKSLYRHYFRSTTDFEVHVLCLDQESYDAVNQQNWRDFNIVAHLWTDAQDSKAFLTRRRFTMPRNYFCWMLASYWTAFLKRQLKADEVTYLDADMYFFEDAKLVFEAMGDAKVAVVPHNFPPESYDRLIQNGRYNVGWVTFRDWVGGEILSWWGERCIEQCDESTVGDQKYLDRFPEMMNPADFCELPHGMGTGPWNINRYECREMRGRPVLIDRDRVEYPLVFYHFHEHWRKGRERTGYPLTEEVVRIVYQPYESELLGIMEYLK